MNIQAVAPASVDHAQMSAIDNTIPIEAWNTVLFEKFCRFRYLLSHGLAGHSDEFFGRKSYPAGARVLDVGCGFGDTTRSIAAQIGPGGHAVGVDCAQNFIDLAARETAEASINNVSFLVADAQCDDLRGPYDYVFSGLARCSSICRG
jgi:2-polyprenyl-3-methyl-5-hydroxy-6-metoxy-1,4-benzoquinol methylase